MHASVEVFNCKCTNIKLVSLRLVDCVIIKSYQTYLGEIKSRQRDEAAAFDNKEYRYY